MDGEMVCIIGKVNAAKQDLPQENQTHIAQNPQEKLKEQLKVDLET